MEAKAVSHVSLDDPPPIEHVTQNFVPLRSVLLNVTARCGKELANVLRTIESLPSDTARKRQFLDFVVASRQEYVKLYVLCKWAIVSPDISRAIDVANWLFGQVNCFNNVVGALFRLQADLSAAKAPWADLETGLQVYKYGQPTPTPEAKLFLPVQKLSDAEVLRILRRLDVLIAVRLALHEQLPPLYQSYVVSNGRARFDIGEGVFWVEFGIVEEVVAAQSRFFFVDCGLGAGAGKESLTPAFKQRMEVAINEQLASVPLVRVLDWVSLFCSVHELQLLDRQLAAAEREAGLWAGTLSHSYNPAKSEIIIRYSIGSREPNEILLSMQKTAPHTLVASPPIDGVDLRGPIASMSTRLLAEATKQHAARIISSIEASWIVSLSQFTLALECTPSKRIELSIDPISARFALSGGGKLISDAQDRLNNSSYAPIQVLNELRIQVSQEIMASRAKAAGWSAQPNVKLAPGELTKIAPASTLLALRLPKAQGWCLAVALGGAKSHWFATRLQCSQRRWYLGPMHEVHTVLNLEDPDYSTFIDLAESYMRQFTLYELGRELTTAQTRHTVIAEGNQNLKIVVDLSTIEPESSSWAYSGLVCTVSDHGIRAVGRAHPGHLAPLGDTTETLGSAEIVISGHAGTFEISTRQDPEQLSCLIEAIKVLHHAAQSLTSATSLGLEVRAATLSSLEIRYAAQNGVLSVHNGSTIVFAESNPQKSLAPFLPAVQNQSSGSLNQVVSFLKESYPIWEILAQIREQRPELQLVILPQMANKVRIQLGFDSAAPYLELSHRHYRGKRVVHLVKAFNGAETIPTIAQLFASRTHTGVIPLVTGCVIEVGHEAVLRAMVESGLAQNN